MVKLSVNKTLSKTHGTFIDEVVNALFDSYRGDYLITIDSSKFVDDDGQHAGFCHGDDVESVIDIATHFYYEDGDIGTYSPVEVAGNLAHELIHAKQFAHGQINMVDHVWRHGKETVDCSGLSYNDTPWEVEAYTLEPLLVDILWENV